ncbi:MAG: MlaE family lipid ABC transporter permease subunit [Sulfurimicrobium sp.]
MTKKSEPYIAAVAGEDAVRCRGLWAMPHINELERALAGFSWPEGERLLIDCAQVEKMDTAGAWLLYRTRHTLERAGKTLALVGLKPELSSLLSMVEAHGAETSAASPRALGWLEQLGYNFVCHLRQASGMLAFIGEAALAALRLVARPARLRLRPLLYNIQETGFSAMPIVGLLSFLMGVVVSYQGAEQLARYGASIFVADLVGLSMLREMAPLLTAIIVAGRSGSAFTAQIGTMKVTEEIDAMRTIGIAPMDFLVLPKILALMLSVPLLTVYADVAGVLGGMVMAKSQLGIGFAEFLDRFNSAIKLSSYLVGLGKALVFAAIIGVVGCFQGFQVSGSADSVGQQTTVSVVQAIFLVIVMDAVFSILFSWLGI